ncbi:MAG: hypothetical protein AB8B53_08790 [Flavobacteriales bacterium]
MKKLVISVLSGVLFLASCGHTHEHTPVMKEVIQMNTQLWDDLNTLKSDVNVRLKSATTLTGELDSVAKVEMSEKLILLTTQKTKLKELDAKVPSLEGYEPECNHEPGEPHEHNNIKVNGMPEVELLELHQLLKQELDEVKEALK